MIFCHLLPLKFSLGYPIRLPLGLESLRTQDDPDAYTDIFGSLPAMDQFQARDCDSSRTINVLTMNHGNRELKSMPVRDRPITRMLLHNSAHILCPNEADAFLDPKTKMQGTHPIVYPLRVQVACFVCGNELARVELLAGYISTRSEKWGSHIRHVQMFLRRRDRLHRSRI